MLIKICGLTSLRDAEMAMAAGADLLGFIFVPGTPRALVVEQVGWIRELRGPATVGVFRDAGLETMRRTRDDLELDWIQLHGDEPDSVIDAIGPKVIRRVRPGQPPGWGEVCRLADRCLPLLDPGSGSGTPWRWQTMGVPPEGVRFGIAGGLEPSTVAEAVRRLRPAMVDVSSGVEVEPGVKSRPLVEGFIEAARGAASEGMRE